MDKTYRNELQRIFLIENLPEPLKPAARHAQIFDNYIENTRLRLRSVRVPETKQWTFILQQRIAASEDLTHLKIAEIYLSEAEHHAFEIFEGREIRKNERAEGSEIRKNRYLLDLNNHIIEIDVFLGDLWGLNLARVVFEEENDLKNFEVPSFFIAEVTSNLFFTGENLVGKKFADVQIEFAKMNKESEGN